MTGWHFIGTQTEAERVIKICDGRGGGTLYSFPDGSGNGTGHGSDDLVGDGCGYGYSYVFDRGIERDKDCSGTGDGSGLEYGNSMGDGVGLEYGDAMGDGGS
jgi:hypothetical protein